MLATDASRRSMTPAARMAAKASQRRRVGMGEVDTAGSLRVAEQNVLFRSVGGVAPGPIGRSRGVSRPLPLRRRPDPLLERNATFRYGRARVQHAAERPARR